MGIGAGALDVLLELHRSGAFSSGDSICELGAQELHCTPQDIQKFAQAFGEDWSEKDGNWAGDLFQRCGFEYTCIDIMEDEANLILDLNVDPVPDEHKGRYQLVTNFGTTEHVANQVNAFKIIHDLTAVGGTMVHNLPVAGHIEHGLVTYTAKFFPLLRDANEYKKVMIAPAEFTYHELPDSMSDYIDCFERWKSPIANSFIWAVFQKKKPNSFSPPFDGNLKRAATSFSNRYHQPKMYGDGSPPPPAPSPIKKIGIKSKLIYKKLLSK